MKKLLSLFLLSALFIFSCGNKSETKKEQGTTAGAKEKIVTSVPPLRWLTQKIAGDDFEVISIVQPNMNHELFEPKPSDLKTLENSKVFFTYNMLGFEETISDSLSDKNKIVNVLDGVDKNLFIKGDHDHDHDHEHEHEHGHEHDKKEEHEHHHEHEGHGGIDPHVWFSLDMMPKIAENIKNELSKLYPEKKETFEKNYNAFITELNQVKAELSQKMASKTKKSFMIYHPALNYFLKNYAIEEISIEQEGKEPSAQQIKEIIDEAKEHNITTILVQPQFPKQSAEAISKEIPNSKVAEFNVDKENVFENLKQFVDYLN
ncbi:metal ABC transporter substrate-binding protein [Leptotrichia massiliensis]|uniref:metal ABC transporter substrate-binding protein n=1 Tax=Leptotrichia massiliensis TaxID=1852388 RepID=UPI0008D9A9D7|nr:metal ABC transporter substrate-binding protein [Leptotrichia massiliensis]